MKHPKNHFASVCIAVAACVALASCEHADPLERDPIEPTLASIQENVFNTSCAFAQCHAGPNAQMGLNLSEGQARANLVNVDSREVPSFKRVEPGNPDDSYLVMKIEGDSRIDGQRMPLNSPALSAEQIGAIREWIANGAE